MKKFNSDVAIQIELNDDSFRMVAAEIHDQYKVATQLIPTAESHLVVLEIDETWCSTTDLINIYRVYDYLREEMINFCSDTDTYHPKLKCGEHIQAQYTFTRITTSKLYAIVDTKDIFNNILNIYAIFSTTNTNRDLFTPVFDIVKFVPINPVFCALRNNDILNTLTLFSIKRTLANPVKYTEITLPALEISDVSPVHDILSDIGYSISRYTLVKEIETEDEGYIEYLPGCRGWLVGENIHLYRLEDVVPEVDDSIWKVIELLSNVFVQLKQDENEGMSAPVMIRHVQHLLTKYNMRGFVVTDTINISVILYRLVNDAPIELVDILTEDKSGKTIRKVLNIVNQLAKVSENIIPLWVRSMTPKNRILPIYTSAGFKVSMKTMARPMNRTDYSKFLELLNTDAKCQ